MEFQIFSKGDHVFIDRKRSTIWALRAMEERAINLICIVFQEASVN